MTDLEGLNRLGQPSDGPDQESCVPYHAIILAKNDMGRIESVPAGFMVASEVF